MGRGLEDAAFLLLRVVLVCIVPGIASIVGIDSGAFVFWLSVAAVILEIALITVLRPATGPKSRKSIRPARFFTLQLGGLYALQLWWLCLHTMVSAEKTNHDASAETAREHHAPPPRPLRPQDAFSGFLGSARQVAEAEVHGGGRTKPAVDAPPVDKGSSVVAVERRPGKDGEQRLATPRAEASGGFQLDAPLEALRWDPKTMSVVLPCAEEREYALRTVQSVYNSLPAEKLHEIVVVDDGSYPPLAETHLQPSVQRQYKVKIMRHENTVGLIGAKKTGGDAATGDIIVFFDCHVAPQKNWYEDFFSLIAQNYRRMVVPQITGLDISTWTQIGSGGGMAKCYVTWDGDFKWGGEDDMYMAMISGGLAALSRRWWQESGGYDAEMLGWGGENIDQGIRMWVCGGEIVMAPHAQVAHMWRTGDSKTHARYKHVGDTTRNRGRAIYAWYGEFTEKLDDFPAFAFRKKQYGANWVGDMSTFQAVKDRLQGCRPFAWYLKRFKGIYEDAGIIPAEIFMIREDSTRRCLLFQGQAGTSGAGREGVVLADCDSSNDRFFWHLGNKDQKKHRCCSGLRAWNTEQCFEGGQPGGVKAATSICEISGRNGAQRWTLHGNGQLRRGASCMGTGDSSRSLKEADCDSLPNSGKVFFKYGSKVPIETQLYQKAQREHPEVFEHLLAEQKVRDAETSTPQACRAAATSCIVASTLDGRCLDADAQLTPEQDDGCAPLIFAEGQLKNAENGGCLDTWSDANADTWGFYGCHGGQNQRFVQKTNDQLCVTLYNGMEECFKTRLWHAQKT